MNRTSSPLLAFVPRGPQPGDTDERAHIAAVVHRLEASQWRTPEEIAQLQFAALVGLAGHLARHSPLFAENLRTAGLKPADLATPAGLAALPTVSRRDFQRPQADVFCASVPAAHGRIGEAASSGSTGEPVVVRRTEYNHLLFQAMTIRLHLWHGLGAGLRYCASRASLPEVIATDTWAGPPGQFWPTGAMLQIPNNVPISRQAELIANFAPDILLIYPSNIIAIAQHLETRGTRPFRPRQIRTTSETLSSHDRATIKATWQCPVVDLYSSTETGYVALQCPDSDLYHVMWETHLVEILREDGTPCKDREIGRIVITDLNNFATPMVRYAIGDYAEAGPLCPCGRGMQTLRRIVGRERNLILMPDGSRHWPLTGRSRYREVAPVLQYQMIQHDREGIEVRLVVDRPLSDNEEQQLKKIMLAALGHPFQLNFVYFEDRLPTGQNGKLEEFLCLL